MSRTYSLLAFLMILSVVGCRSRVSKQPNNILKTSNLVPQRGTGELIGLSREARPIVSYTFGEGENVFLFVGGAHGGYEYNSILLAYKVVEYFQEHGDEIPENATLVVVPNLNPDGLHDLLKDPDLAFGNYAAIYDQHFIHPLMETFIENELSEDNINVYTHKDLLELIKPVKKLPSIKEDSLMLTESTLKTLKSHFTGTFESLIAARAQQTTPSSGRINANGVDLNRNFDCQHQQASKWKYGDLPNGGGTEPFSEPETRALKHFIEAIQPTAAVFWHSAYNKIFPAGCTTEESPNKPVLFERSAVLANIYGTNAATPYPVSDTSTFGAYIIHGDATDWLSTIGIPGITVELMDHENDEFERNLPAIKALFENWPELI